ncbi:saccharopine dehydrogenase NADP-binding domain-containing protein [Streptomyces sp. BA2]|uniref:saccharopine dehydrogenase NADP-binding domain-containing protein n=1 Tax=Streptomyces sp. BA2 TaxID=436595 RepID=UPI0013220E99|nr:saccharopine dehydrogenase NADP-binding domain-containing protein [Streptomyces sp. BA2]MWA16239.1 saccharopine dehydrogenase [Streptomyces sp. BA2]
MDSTPKIGILGGYGAVGSAVVRRLRQAGIGPLLVGGRDRARAEAVLGTAVGAEAVDLWGPSLDSFVSRCRLVVNCAGPSYRVLDTVARAALRHGVDYVDAAGDDPVHARLTAEGDGAWQAADRAAVLSAGALPGLSGLLPRVLLDPAVAPARLEGYVGGVAALTPAAAGDVLLARGPEHGTPSAAWEDGRIRDRALEPRRDLRLPAFPQPVAAFPYLPTETARLAGAVGIRRVHWYTVFGGERLAEELAMAWALDSADTTDLVRAADEDVRRHGSWYGQEFRVWHDSDEGPPARTLTLRAEDSYELSGFLAAVATQQVLSGGVRPGVHFAADVLDPQTTAKALAADAVAEVDIT